MLIYLAPAISNVIWGAGGIVAKLGIVDANPLLFLLIRAGIAGPFLSAVAFIIHRELPAPAFWPRTLLGGVTVFFDQCFYIVGIKISSGTTSALWQPTQPIFACALAIVIGMERFSLLKVIGIVVGAAGAMFASVYGVEDSGVSSERLLYGSLCFFINCSGAAMYAIVAKRLLELSKYSTLSVLGWSSTVAAALSAAITTACGSSPAARVCLVASPPSSELHLVTWLLPRHEFNAGVWSECLGCAARTAVSRHQLLRPAAVSGYSPEPRTAVH